MKAKFLIACSLGLSCLSLSSATVNTISGESPGFLVFQSADGQALSGGTFSIGAFNAEGFGEPPTQGIGFFDVED